MTLTSTRRARRVAATVAGVALAAIALSACATGGGSASESASDSASPSAPQPVMPSIVLSREAFSLGGEWEILSTTVSRGRDLSN